MQLILCQSEHLPLHIVADVFDSLLLIINSADKIVENFTGKLQALTVNIVITESQRLEIGELVKNICLAVLNWELKHTDDHYGLKKHQEEFIIIKNQEVRRDKF